MWVITEASFFMLQYRTEKKWGLTAKIVTAILLQNMHGNFTCILAQSLCSIALFSFIVIGCIINRTAISNTDGSLYLMCLL